ncbi:MAG TPA: hypothetical protein DIU00_16005 [Phycisphaerales bacterium]|nr:hypothetical protein [Phycisphaerales bacterium]
MSQIDENKILDCLKRLSQVVPGQEATARAIQKARDVLIAGEGRRVGLAPPSFIGRLMKLAAAAVLMIGAGFIGGRLSAPEPLDVQELQIALESSLKSSLVPAIQQELLSEMDDRWQSTLATSNVKVKDELARQVRRDLTEFAAQTLAASGTRTDQRLNELIRLIEAARIQDRQRMAAAFDYIESRFGSGLVTLAARTDDLLCAERGGPAPDVSEN